MPARRSRIACFDPPFVASSHTNTRDQGTSTSRSRRMQRGHRIQPTVWLALMLTGLSRQAVANASPRVELVQVGWCNSTAFSEGFTQRCLRPVPAENTPGEEDSDCGYYACNPENDTCYVDCSHRSYCNSSNAFCDPEIALCLPNPVTSRGARDTLVRCGGSRMNS